MLLGLKCECWIQVSIRMGMARFLFFLSFSMFGGSVEIISSYPCLRYRYLKKNEEPEQHSKKKGYEQRELEQARDNLHCSC